jgi:hypothetical protein
MLHLIKLDALDGLSKNLTDSTSKIIFEKTKNILEVESVKFFDSPSKASNFIRCSIKSYTR